MFVILQICYIANICVFIIWYKIGITLFLLVLNDIWDITMLFAHSIFVIKYYAISLAISEVLQNKQDKYISLKVWSVSIAQTIFIIISVAYYKPIIIDSKHIIINFFSVLPAYFIVAVLTIAFIKLRNTGGMEHSLSMFQIIL